MTNKINKIKLTTIFTILALNSYAVNVDGIFKQGGLVAISYKANENPTFNGKQIQKNHDLVSYFPLDRNSTQFTVNGKKYNVAKQDYKIQHVKGVKKKHVEPDKKHMDRIGRESKQIKTSRKFDSKKYFNTLLPQFILPSEGVETGVYGSSRTYNGQERSWHKGLDIANKQGTLIIAPLKGKVVLAMKDSFFNGNLVIIDHGRKIYSIYAHMYDIIANKGDILETGDPIGLIGSTGRSTGPHLHWGVYIGQKAIDPKLLLVDNSNKEK